MSKHFFRHVELDRKLPGVAGSYTKETRVLGIFRRVYCYDFTSRRRFERAMRLSDFGTRVINFLGAGR